MKFKAVSKVIGKFFRQSEGSLAVEFALTAIPMVLLVGGLVEFARYSYAQSALNFAAEEATRYAVVRGGSVTESELIAVAQDSMLQDQGRP